MQNLELKTHKIENLFFLQFLCASIIPLLVLGPFFPDLILSSLSIWFIYFTVKNKLYDKFNNIYFFIFIVFCFISIISSILSENIYVSLKSSSFYFRIGIFALLISFLIEQDRKILNYFYYSFLATFSILVVDGYLQYFTGFNIYMAFAASGKIWSAAKAFGWFNIFSGSFVINDNMKHNHGLIVETLHLDQAG